MDDQDRVWALCARFRVCMLASRDGAFIRARPLEPSFARKRGVVEFLIGVEGHKDDEVADDPRVCLVFIDAEANDYAALTGEARIRNDRARVRALWRDGLETWWSGPEDARLRILEVAPIDAQIWDRRFKDDAGENQKVSMRR